MFCIFVVGEYIHIQPHQDVEWKISNFEAWDRVLQQHEISNLANCVPLYDIPKVMMWNRNSYHISNHVPDTIIDGNKCSIGLEEVKLSTSKDVNILCNGGKTPNHTTT